MNKKIAEQIKAQVANYRAAAKSEKEAVKDCPQAVRAYRSQMDRASGALDVLFKLDPKSPAWAETKWIH